MKRKRRKKEATQTMGQIQLIPGFKMNGEKLKKNNIK